MSRASITNRSNKSEIILQKDIFRLAALLYTETTSTFSSIDVQSHMVKCVFAESNSYMSIDDIILYILNNYKYHISEEELEKILKKSTQFESQIFERINKYRLQQQEYDQIVVSMSLNIEYYINMYIKQYEIENYSLFRDAIYKYLYELTTTNINSYKILLSLSDGSNLTDSDLSVNVDDLSDIERQYVNAFIIWENVEKNVILSNLVFCCLEYCLLVSGDKPNRLLSDTIRNREVFLDTNIIFRALGINGVSRKNVVVAFLNKCKQANVKLIIGRPTKVEFLSTVDYYISQIKEFPRGKVFAGAHELLSEYNLYSLYDEWLLSHENLSLQYFRNHIAALYADFVRTYKIHDDLSIPDDLFRSDKFKMESDIYARGIIGAKKQVKGVYISEDTWLNNSDKHDASMIRYIELYRNECPSDSDTFFVSSDKGLRYWDMTRLHQDYPVVVYPSQLFLVLIKMCGRSENDLESFVNFINIRPRSEQLSAEKANIIISGISSITEDIKTQQSIISMVMDADFQNIIKHSNTDQDLYQHAQLFSQKYLEIDLENKKQEITHLSKSLQEKDAIYVELCSDMVQKDANLQEKKNEIESHREKICAFAEKKVRPVHIFRWYVVSIFVLLYIILVIFFIFFQFLYSDAPWNVATSVLVRIGKTTFGKGVEDYIYIVDNVLFLTAIYLKKFIINPFNQIQRNRDLAERVETYMEKNKIL